MLVSPGQKAGRTRAHTGVQAGPARKEQPGDFSRIEKMESRESGEARYGSVPRLLCAPFPPSVSLHSRGWLRPVP